MANSWGGVVHGAGGGEGFLGGLWSGVAGRPRHGDVGGLGSEVELSGGVKRWFALKARKLNRQTDRASGTVGVLKYSAC